jgi:hypothetical protein
VLAAYTSSFLFLFLLLYGAGKEEATTTYHYVITQRDALPGDRPRPAVDPILTSSVVRLDVRPGMTRPDTRFSSSLVQLAGMLIKHPPLTSRGGIIAHPPLRQSDTDTNNGLSQTPIFEKTPDDQGQTQNRTASQATPSDTTTTQAATDDDDGAVTLDRLVKENAEIRKQNQEINQRLDRIEKLLSGGQVTLPKTIPSDTSTPQNPDMKSLPGWLVEMHPWRADGRLSKDAESAIVVENCHFNGTFGQDAPTDMKIYHFQGIFHADEAGRYVFGMDLVCGYGHACTMNYNVDGGTLLQFNGRTERQRLLDGTALTAGDHKLDFTLRLNHNSFIKYDPANRLQWEPFVKGPQDLNPRDFTPDELFIQLPKSQNIGSRKC